MKSIYLHLLTLAVLLVACGENQPSEVPAHPHSEDGFYSQLKKNSDLDEPDESTGLGRLSWEIEEHDFGDIRQGDFVSYAFKFTNTGQGPLLITDTKTRCGCTVPEWSKDPVMPGQQGELTVVYDSRGQIDQQSKAIVVYCDGTPRKTALVVRANVKPKNE